ncbi:uncharacterized protein LOC125778260 [Bactrocera dorsalis]|uniref:Uncharacterized protein LOC125778260 n=1 Tax=Bactrocera dorsalis TaxID=27457 RepID=A0ABM3JP12_BACDO|nr:uncharacterized protein LOC125778260 [Bactrocera dorsalis]
MSDFDVRRRAAMSGGVWRMEGDEKFRALLPMSAARPIVNQATGERKSNEQKCFAAGGVVEVLNNSLSLAPSLIWAYCTKVNNGSKVKCNLCHKEFIFNKSTSTMMKHLQCAHKIAPPSSNEKQTQKRLNDSHNDFEVQPKKALVAVESSVPSVALVPQTKSSVQENTTVQSHVQCCMNNANSFSSGGYRHDEATTALLRMIAVDNMPLCTTERPGFRKFIKTLQLLL